MSYTTTGQDILTHVLFRGGEDVAASSDYTATTKTHIMRAYADVVRFAPFPWALKHPPGVLSLVATVTGTVSSISGVTWTLAATIATSQVGKQIVLDGENIPYRILTHTAGTASLTVDATYTEDTTTGAYTIFQDEYALASDCMRPWWAWFRNRPMDLMEFITPDEAASEYPRRTLYSTKYPYTLSLLRYDANNVPLVRLIPWVSEAATIEYEYGKRPPVLTFDGVAGTDTPFIPLEDRIVLADRALFYLLVDKNDDRADGHFLASQAKLEEMKLNYLGMPKARFRPRVGARLGV